jgi:hypothetical protein
MIPKKLSIFREEIKILNPNAQSIPYDMDSWKHRFTDDLDVTSIIQRFPDAITRKNIKGLGDETKYNRENARKLFIAAMIWGYGTTAYGPYRVRAMLDNELANMILGDTIQKIVERDIKTAYRDFELRGCGPAFMTKFFYFIGLSANVKPLPLILDSRVAQSLILLLKDEGLYPTDFVKFSVNKNGRINVSRYPDGYIRYIELMDEWSQELGCHADAIEFFLFNPPQEFGSTGVITNAVTKQVRFRQKSDDQFLALFDDVADFDTNLPYHVQEIATKEVSVHHSKRWSFFEQLLTLSRNKAGLFNNISPRDEHYVIMSIRKARLAWAFTADMKTNVCEVVLYFPSRYTDTNKTTFAHLASHKKDIEESFGELLTWDFKEEGRDSQEIRTKTPIGGVKDEDKWPEIQNDMVNRLIRLEKAFSPYIKTLK